MSFSRDLSYLGIEPASLISPALAGGFFTTRATWEAPYNVFFFFLSGNSLTVFFLLSEITLCLKVGGYLWEDYRNYWGRGRRDT